ncbi:MAG: hypothetical protein NC548_62685, partial [Lachnospiraceae bacterium]|nr:hypothetical protein [Lachnospiraceae bacterium]
LDKILKHTISDDALRIYEQIRSHADMTQLVCKLLSMVLQDSKVLGPNKIGLNKKDLKTMQMQLDGNPRRERQNNDKDNTKNRRNNKNYGKDWNHNKKPKSSKRDSEDWNFQEFHKELRQKSQSKNHRNSSKNRAPNQKSKNSKNHNRKS